MASSIVSACLLSLSISAITNASQDYPEPNPKALSSCGLFRNPMLEYQFKYIANESSVDPKKYAAAFEGTVLASIELEKNKQSFSPPNRGGKVVPDGIGPVNRYADSVFLDAKTSPKITLKTDQIERFLDYLANRSSASYFRGGGKNPIPILYLITPAETVIDQSVINAANFPEDPKLRYRSGQKRRVAVYQSFICHPTPFDKLIYGNEVKVVVGTPVPVNEEVLNLDGYQPGTKVQPSILSPIPVDIPSEYKLPPKGNEKNSSDLPTKGNTEIEFEIIIPPPPDEPPPPDDRPMLCLDSSDGWEYYPCSASGATDETSNIIGWGFGIGSDYLS